MEIVRKKVGDLFDMKLGKMLSGKNFTGQHLKPYLRNANVQWGRIDLSSINEMDFDDRDFERYKLEKGDILVCEGGEVGRTAIYNGEIENCCYQNALHRLRVKNGSVDPKYFLHYMNFAASHGLIKRETSTVTIPHFTAEKFKEFEIPLPDIKTQQKIAGILEQADAARQKRKQANQLTEQFLQSAFLEMFGDPVKNEKGWGEKEIQEIVSVPLQNGAYFTKENYSENGEGVEMIHMADAFYGIAKRGAMRRVLASEKEIEKYSVDHNDILIARRSLTFDGAAKPCMIEKGKEKLIFESSLIKITPNQKMILPIYLYYFFSNERARAAYLMKSVTSSTISGINQSNLSTTKMLVPSLPLQKKFATLVEQVEQLRVKQRESEKELENLFQSLMQRYFG